ncbi:MAG: class I SAM-dependent methyltransferase [Calditrichaeota bacterium]|nr:class I SAM-dependent methyltransferase [Calditrichota bacterium]
MKNDIKWFFRRKFTFLRVMNYKRLLCFTRNSYLAQTGWTESLRRGYPCDAEGRPLPWMNYSFIAFIKERLQPEMVVLEFGAGYSSLFWAAHVKHVFSVEHDAFFIELLKDELPGNVTVYHAAPGSEPPYYAFGEYISTRNGGLKFDIVVIDGLARVQCARRAPELLTHRGVIILDDSQRPEYREAHTFLQRSGFKHLTFEGLKPADRGVNCTTIFYRDANCLQI